MSGGTSVQAGGLSDGERSLSGGCRPDPTTAPEPFGVVLRRLRLAAGLTQERLAARSGISATGVAALEAGRRKAPRLTTVGLLCDALRVTAEDRTALLAAAGGTAPGSNEALAESAIAAPTTPSGAEHRRTTGRSFVGRHYELQVLRNAWVHRPGVALVSGEAGVGKSTLAEKLASELADQGATVLVGRSTPQQLGVFEAFIDPVRSALGRFDAGVPRDLRELGRLVPGLVGPDAALLIPSRSDPSVERRVLFESVVSLFAGCGPTILILDDLHWADAGTQALLEFLASSRDLTDLMIVGTIRSTDATTATRALLVELRRRCTVTSVDLRGLRHDELVDLVGQVAGTDVTADVIATVSEATNGNPLFIRELTEHLLQHGGTGAGGLVPHGIRDTFNQRVAGLSQEGQTLLRGAAVLGQTFDVFLAGELVGLTGDVLLGAVEDALVSGLVVERSATTAAFSHGLVATAIYDGTTRLRRAQLHRSAAMLLAGRAPTAPSAIVDVARHWAIVARDEKAASQTAAQWSVRAGDAALGSASIDEAIAWFESAFGQWSEPGGDVADTLVRLGTALTTVGRMNDGKAHLQRALEVAGEIGDAGLFARAALELSATVPYTEHDPERIAELERAIVKLGPTEKVMRPAVWATLRRQLAFVNTPEADERRVAAAAVLAEVVDDPNVSEDLLISLGRLRDTTVVDDPIPMGRLARSVIAVANTRQDLPALAIAWYRQAFSAFELGQGDLLRQSVDEYRAIAQRLRRPYELALSASMTSAIAQIEGRYGDAEEAGQESLAHAATIDDRNYSWIYFANAGMRSYDEGNAAVTLDLMRAVRADFGQLMTFEAALAAIAAAVGDGEFANQLFDEQVGEGGAVLDRHWSYLGTERPPVVGLLAWGCAAAGDTMRATILRDRLERIAEFGVRAVRMGPVGAWVGPLDHHVGALSRVLGDLDRAERHLLAALDVETVMRGRPFAVRTMLELALLAETRDARGGSAGGVGAAEWRARAEQTATSIGLESILATVPPAH